MNTRSRESGLAIDRFAELHSYVETFQGESTDGSSFERNWGSAGAIHTYEIPVFSAEVTEIVLNKSGGQGEKASLLFLHLLHSPTFDVEEVRKILKSTSDCKDFCEKEAEHEILKSEFKNTFITYFGKPIFKVGMDL